MKLTETKPTEKSSKKLKLSIFNIKSLLVFNKKKLDKIKKEKKKFSLFQMKKKKVEEKENKIESPRTVGSTLKNIGKGLLAKPLSIIDKLKEFFGIILLGVLVNNLPTIVKKLQDVLGQIKKFFDDNPWIGKVITFTFDIIAKGMMGILDLTKILMPVIGGSFKFALDTIKTAGKEIGKAISIFDQLDAGISAVMNAFGYKPPAKAAQSYAKSKGKYYSSTTGKTYANYKSALKDPKVKQGAQQQATQKSKKIRQVPTASGGSYNPNTGYTYNPNFKDPAQAVGVLAPKGGVMGTMIPGQKDTWREYGPGENKNIYKQNVQRYSTVNQAQKVQKLSIGGTVRNFFGGMFGSRRGLGNIPPQEGTGRGGPSDIRMATKDSGQSYTSPYASPAGTAKGRKARETVNYFKFFENNVKNEERNLVGEEKNLTMFSEFMKSYSNLLDIRKKYGDTDLSVPPGPGGTSGLPDEAISVNENEVIGKVGSTGQSTGPHIHLEAMSSDKKIPLSLRKNIFVSGKSLTSNNWPISSPVGNRIHPITGKLKFHAGEDWPAPSNSQITLRGGVKFVKYIPEGSDPRYSGYGNVSVIQDTDGKQYFMGHLNAGPTNLSALVQRQQQQLSKKIPGGTNAEKVWNFFKSKKYDGKPLSDFAVAGIMGNAQQESGFNPTIAHSMKGNGGKFIGIFQWGNKGNGDRWGNLKKWAKNNGDLDPESIDTQLKFTWVELGGSYGHVLPKLQAARTPEEAAKVWYDDYEAASHGLSNRQNYAKGFYTRYKGKGGQSSAPVAAPLTKTQQLEKNIVETMVEKYGTRSMTVGDKNITVEKSGDKNILKITTGGIFGIGARQLQLNETLLNNLLFEIRKKAQSVQPVQTPPPSTEGAGARGYGGANASNDLVIVKETLVAVVESPPEVITNTVNNYVPILISQNSSASRSLRSTLS
jgi:hypothetical protein